MFQELEKDFSILESVLDPGKVIRTLKFLK